MATRARDLISRELVAPKSIVVVGGSSNLASPGGRLLKNILDGKCGADLYVVNPKGESIQGVRCFRRRRSCPRSSAPSSRSRRSSSKRP